MANPFPPFQELTSQDWQNYQQAISPTALLDATGTLFEAALASNKDYFADRVRLSIKAKLPGLAPSDALAQLGLERGITQNPGEADTAFAQRVLHAWDTWPWAGSARGVLRALSDAGYPNVAIVQQNGGSFTLDQGGANLLVWSTDLGNSAGNTIWGVTGGGTGSAPVVTRNFAAAPDGTITAARVQFNQGAGTAVGDVSVISQTYVGGVDGLPHAAEVWLRTNDASNTTIAFNPTQPVFGQFTLLAVTPTWQKFTITGVMPAGSTRLWRLGLRGTITTALTADILVAWPQIEQNAAPQAYVPTEKNQVSASVGAGNLNAITSAPRWHVDVQSPRANPTVWASGAVYGRNAIAVPSPANGFFYETEAGGTAGTTQPTFPTTLGATVGDGSVTWVCRGRDFWSRFAVIFFSPLPSSWAGTPPVYASQEVTRIRNLINQWKSAHSTCVGVTVLTQGKLLGYQQRVLGSANGVLGATSTVWTPI